MGFSESEARLGLRACQGDTTSAIDYITRKRQVNRFSDCLAFLWPTFMLMYMLISREIYNIVLTFWIMHSKAICGQVLIPLINTRSPLTFNQHLWSPFDKFLTVSQLLTDCWLNVNWVLIEMPIKGTHQQSITDAISSCDPTFLTFHIFATHGVHWSSCLDCHWGGSKKIVFTINGPMRWN